MCGGGVIGEILCTGSSAAEFTDKADSLFHRAFFGYAALRFRSYGFTVVVNATAIFLEVYDEIRAIAPARCCFVSSSEQAVDLWVPSEVVPAVPACMKVMRVGPFLLRCTATIS
jgi:hypothetical protein